MNKHIHFIKNDISQKALRLYEQGERIGLVEDSVNGSICITPSKSKQCLLKLIEKYKTNSNCALATLENCGGQDFGFEIIR